MRKRPQLAAKILLLLILLCLSACKEQIIHGLGERDANRILTKLHGHQISVEKIKQADGSWAIAVDSSRSLEAIKFLDDTRLLRDARPGVNSSTSMLSSREDQRFRYERSLSSAIESTLSSLEGVLQARVHLNLPVTDPLFGRSLSDGDSSSASILLVTTAELAVKEAEIAKLVAGAAGIQPEKISVLFSHGAGTSRAEDRVSPAASKNPQPEISQAVLADFKTSLPQFLFEGLSQPLAYAALTLFVLGAILIGSGIRAKWRQSVWG